MSADDNDANLSGTILAGYRFIQKFISHTHSHWKTLVRNTKRSMIKSKALLGPYWMPAMAASHLQLTKINMSTGGQMNSLTIGKPPEGSKRHGKKQNGNMAQRIIAR